MKDELRKLLRNAERSPGWTANSRDPWEHIIAHVSDSLELEPDGVHAIKVQLSSARKSLWQGRLHRRPARSLVVAVDEPCDADAFERVFASVVERFSPPSVWADACFVLSDGEVIGVVEREGVGISDWIQSERPDLQVQICSPVPDQLDLASRLEKVEFGPAKFIRAIEAANSKAKQAAIVSRQFGLASNSVLVSLATAPANAAKGRWEGGDVDPERRYRVAVVGADGWDWISAALEIMHRMDPPDLSLELVVLCAKSSESAGWSRFRAVVARDAEQRVELVNALHAGGISDVRLVERSARPVHSESSPERKKLRVRDSDAGDIRYEVSRPKQRIHDAMTNWLLEWADHAGYEVSEGEDGRALFDALIASFPADTDMLVEVKSTAELGAMRLAVGQLIDYRRVLKEGGNEPSCLVLLPPNEIPTKDMKDLIWGQGFLWGTIIQKVSSSGLSLVFRVYSPDGTFQDFPSN